MKPLDIPALLSFLVMERERANLTQRDIADRMGITQPQVSAIELNKNDILLSTLQRYHRAVTGESLRMSIPIPVSLGDSSKRVDFAISA